MHFPVLLLAFVVPTAMAATPEGVGDQLAAKPAAEKVLCLIDEEQPPYMPNIYWCTPSERCCDNEGLPSCCGTSITTDAIMEQVLMWGVLITALLIIGIAAYCYFNDHYCCDSEPDEDGPTGCLCCKTQPEDRYRKGFDSEAALHPDVVHRNRVDDPIFGRLGRPEDVPAYAYIDEETRRRGMLL